jgi:uncharacterized protein YdaU (DUF1376 family)
VHYYQYNIKEFRSGTVNMSRQARWIYRDMLDVYYDTEKPLPLDLDTLCEVIGVESVEERAIVQRLLRFKFVRTEEGYRHTRCDEEIAAYHVKADIAKANGKRGGRPKQAKASDKEPSGFRSGSDPVAIGKQQATGLKTNQEPITKNNKVKPIAQNPDGFARFWAAYPKKKSKGDALKAFKTIKPTEQLLEQMLRAIALAKTSADWRKDGGQYIPYPGTWLRDLGWEDESKVAVGVGARAEILPVEQQVPGLAVVRSQKPEGLGALRDLTRKVVP